MCVCAVLAHPEGGRGRHVTHSCARVLQLSTWPSLTDRHTPGTDRRSDERRCILHRGAGSAATTDSR
jgi:hypothetical protein